jgi:UPF0716 protein FxsA
MRKLVIVSLAFMALEVWSLAFVGSRLGVFAALLLVLAGAVLGFNLIRKSGANLSQLARGRPLDARNAATMTADGLAFALAGFLLMTPGFVSDIMALGALLPWPRRKLGLWLEKHIVTVAPHQRRDGPGAGPVIEGEVVEIPERDGEIIRPS